MLSAIVNDLKKHKIDTTENELASIFSDLIRQHRLKLIEQRKSEIIDHSQVQLTPVQKEWNSILAKRTSAEQILNGLQQALNTPTSDVNSIKIPSLEELKGLMR